MTVSIIVMIVIGIVFIIASFFISEKMTKKESDFNIDLLTIKDDYEFSDREMRIIKRKIEDVIAEQAKDILYETNESLSSMANEKTMALGDYAVAVCEQIEKNHKEVMFLYSMLDDKQKEIMNTVKKIDETKKQIEEMPRTEPVTATGLKQVEEHKAKMDAATDAQAKKESAALEKKGQSLRENENQNVADDVSEKDTPKPDAKKASKETVAEDVEDVFAELGEADTDFEDAFEEEFKDNTNSNDIILEMHRNGSGIIDIAKQLGLGVGEVKLVIDLYQGESS